MNIRGLKLEGEVVETSVRTLSEKEMARVIGGGPPVIVPGENSPTCCCINGCWEPDDCYD